MRSLISRQLQTAASAAAKAVKGTHKPDNGVLWRNMRTMSNTTGLLSRGSDGKRLLFRNMGALRSSTQLIQMWEQQKSNYSMKHQEIEGPTVERDMSEVAKEAREVTESMMKTMYNLSKAVAVLGVSQLAIGAYVMSTSSNSGNILIMSVSAVAFGFPFSMALMMRQSLKAMHFFNKMEKIGRLQLLTSTMQISKNLRLFFLRLRVITYTSVSGLFLSFLYSLFNSTTTTSS